MPISDIPILSMLRTRMQWHQERQRVLAENVANADTPNYHARDLAPPNFEGSVQIGSLTLDAGARRDDGFLSRLCRRRSARARSVRVGPHHGGRKRLERTDRRPDTETA
jgi:flagellar basal body rod protein FlgB